MKQRIASLSLCLFFSLLSRCAAFQDSSCPVLDKYIAVCQAQLACIETEHQWQEFRLDKIVELQEQGFASWLEMKRQQFNVDSNATKVEALQDFISFAKQVSERINSEHPDFNENELKATRVFLPGSNRLVGWLHGIKLKDYSIGVESSNAKFELEVAQRMLASHKQKYESSKLKKDSWSKKRELDGRLAENKVHLRQLEVEYCELIKDQLESGTQDNGNVQVNHTTTPADDSKFSADVWQLANLESNFDGHSELLDRHLKREQSRLSALQKLAVYGHATERDIQTLKKQISKLQLNKNQIQHKQSDLRDALKGLDVPKVTDVPKEFSYASVSQWPENAFSNSSRIQYLIQQRRAYYEEQSKKSTCLIRIAWMNEIVDRLKQASTKFGDRMTAGKDRFTEVLTSGQKKELDDYRWKIETLNQNADNFQSRMTKLQMEESRFLKQVILMDGKGNTRVEIAAKLDLTEFLNTVLTTVHPESFKSGREFNARFGYIESDLMDSIGDNIELVFSQKPGYPLGLFAEQDDLLRPVRLHDYSRSLNFSRRPPTRLSVGPARSGIISNYSTGSSSYRSRNKDIAAPSLYNSPYATDRYRADQIKSNRHFENAYRFGILRSDLRRSARFSQAPWYLPGWPDNLRSNQLRTDYQKSSKGVTGSNELKSKNYLDFSGPGHAN